MFLAAALVLPPTVAAWVPRVLPESDRTRALARDVAARFGAGPYAFYGDTPSLVLCFNLRTEIPYARTADAAAALAQSSPQTVLISIGKDRSPPKTPPAPFEKVDELRSGDQVWAFYRAASR